MVKFVPRMAEVSWMAIDWRRQNQDLLSIAQMPMYTHTTSWPERRVFAVHAPEHRQTGEISTTEEKPPGTRAFSSTRLMSRAKHISCFSRTCANASRKHGHGGGRGRSSC